tara:strand:- start:2789 stop:3115 length:327 start_codon:yes stop_codon:yes gene_type:complete
MLEKKEKILKESKVSDNVRKLLNEFEKSEATKKWLTAVDNRGKFQRDVDKSFFENVQHYLNALSKYVVLLNAGEMYHMVMYRNNIKVHENKCNEMLKEMKKLIEDYGN